MPDRLDSYSKWDQNWYEPLHKTSDDEKGLSSCRSIFLLCCVRLLDPAAFEMQRSRRIIDDGDWPNSDTSFSDDGRTRINLLPPSKISWTASQVATSYWNNIQQTAFLKRWHEDWLIGKRMMTDAEACWIHSRNASFQLDHVFPGSKLLNNCPTLSRLRHVRAVSIAPGPFLRFVL